MVSLETAVMFAATAILLAWVPGPDNLVVVVQSALRGRKAGIAITLGLCTGLVVHTTAVAFGAGTLIASSPLAYLALKVVGAAYLIYLAVIAFTAAPASVEVSSSSRSALPQMYRRGVVMNATNPKIVVFFLAFLPQFVSADDGTPTMQILELGLIFIVCTAICFCAMAFLGGTLSTSLQRSKRAQTVLTRLSGVIYLGLAAKLAFSK